MRGVNNVILSGNVGKVNFSHRSDGSEVLSFTLASSRPAAPSPGHSGGRLTVWVKINVYLDRLIRVCHTKLAKGAYLIVEGELMNRSGKHGELTEVRARELIFGAGRR